ncbi:MAG: sigma-54 dependent transcriptional regulator [candidate division Zixibacteria bacterium]|nr:sigma-54 dependent transcriptional regulator [candidate division Zixibacteria bacterium]
MARNNSKGRLLIVDDSADTRELLQRILSSQGYEVLGAVGVAEALKLLEGTRVDLVITDLKMPGISGLDLVRHIRENLKESEVMMITGYPSVEGAVAAVKSGAEEYLPKPFTREELLAAVDRVMEKLALRRVGSIQIDRRIADTLGIVGESEAMQKVLKAVSKAAAGATPVLVTGEYGTGKELIARAIHYSGSRAEAPFVTVNCMGNPDEYCEKQLYGYRQSTGAGAMETRMGFLQFAEGGTLYLKEVSNLSYAMQTKLFRLLEDRQYREIGSADVRPTNFQVIADSDKNLRALVDKGAFREDLFIRLSMNTISVPALRERGNDVVLLARHYLTKLSKEIGRPVPRFSDHALEVLKNYSWPGNIGELQNLIQRLVTETDGDVIDVPDFPAPMRYSVLGTTGLNRSLAEMEIEHIRNVIASVGGNKTQAAEILGITRKTLREKLKQQANPKADA